MLSIRNLMFVGVLVAIPVSSYSFQLPCPDSDGDGYGSSASQRCRFEEKDCDDLSAAVHPGAMERCNQIDDDCDGKIDMVGSSCVMGCDCGLFHPMPTLRVLSSGWDSDDQDHITHVGSYYDVVIGSQTKDEIETIQGPMKLRRIDPLSVDESDPRWSSVIGSSLLMRGPNNRNVRYGSRYVVNYVKDSKKWYDILDDYIRTSMPGYDGLFLSPGRVPEVEPQPVPPVTVADWMEETERLIIHVRQSFPEVVIWVDRWTTEEGHFFLLHVDGIRIECASFQCDSGEPYDTKNYMRRLDAAQIAIKSGKQVEWFDSLSIPDPRLQTFSWASYQLVREPGLGYHSLNLSDVSPQAWPIQEVDLGEPYGDFESIGTLLMRSFDRGVVYVNSGAESIIIRFDDATNLENLLISGGGRYSDPRSVTWIKLQDRKISLEPYTAAVLRKLSGRNGPLWRN